jgi:hypothetical protein
MLPLQTYCSSVKSPAPTAHVQSTSTQQICIAHFCKHHATDENNMADTGMTCRRLTTAQNAASWVHHMSFALDPEQHADIAGTYLLQLPCRDSSLCCLLLATCMIRYVMVRGDTHSSVRSTPCLHAEDRCTASQAHTKSAANLNRIVASNDFTDFYKSIVPDCCLPINEKALVPENAVLQIWQLFRRSDSVHLKLISNNFTCFAPHLSQCTCARSIT